MSLILTTWMMGLWGTKKDFDIIMDIYPNEYHIAGLGYAK